METWFYTNKTTLTEWTQYNANRYSLLLGYNGAISWHPLKLHCKGIEEKQKVTFNAGLS